MKIWGVIRKNNKIIRDAVTEICNCTRYQIEDWSEAIGPLCDTLDLARPVILKKHISEIMDFSRAVFFPDDFMESINFDKFEIEIYGEKEE